MPVLILAFLSLAIFVATLVMMGIANAAENRELRMRAVLEAPFHVVSIGDAFEQEYAILWETQVPALQLVASGGKFGVSIKRLHSIFRQSARRFPELYDGCSFWQWIAFLEGSALIETGNGRAAITSQGIEFLRYRVHTGVAA